MKYLVALVIALLLSACAGERELQQHEVVPAPMEESLSVVADKDCPANHCESYHLSIKHDLLNVSFGNPKKKDISFVVTPTNRAQLMVLLSDINGRLLDNQLTETSKDCGVSEQKQSKFSVFIDKKPVTPEAVKGVSFVVGCQNLPQAFLNLAQWLDNKVYAQLEN
ncbi:MAG: hypothetical protein KUG78_11190 [Kangiellaceae bacterium]|nr:hypothetical protein [Kangiellaceae bacterium]